MKNGWTEKYDAHAKRLDDDTLAKIRAEMEASGSDADPEQWDQLNAAVDALPPEKPEGADPDNVAKWPTAGVTDAELGVTDNERFVSGDKPGYGSNPIGYPGTDQDQEGPGVKPKTVPGQKPLKKPGE